jgi:hypothetical protein
MANVIKIDGGSGSTPTLITKNITSNGVYNASDDGADGYSSVDVSVSGGSVSKTLLYTFNLSQGGAWINTQIDVTDIDVFLFERVDNSDVNNQTLIEKSDISVYTGGQDVYTNVYRQNGKDMNVRIYNNTLYVSYGSSGSSSYVTNVYSTTLNGYI